MLVEVFITSTFILTKEVENILDIFEITLENYLLKLSITMVIFALSMSLLSLLEKLKNKILINSIIGYVTLSLFLCSCYIGYSVYTFKILEKEQLDDLKLEELSQKTIDAVLISNNIEKIITPSDISEIEYLTVTFYSEDLKTKKGITGLFFVNYIENFGAVSYIQLENLKNYESVMDNFTYELHSNIKGIIYVDKNTKF